MKDKEVKKEKIFLSYIDRSDYTPTVNVDKYVSGKDFVYWGIDNKYPDFIWDIYNKCGALQSIIDGLTDYTVGEEIINNTGIDEENIHGDTIADIVCKLILDRYIYGGFALQVRYNTLGEIIGLAHLDMRKCRIDEYGRHVYVYERWNKWKTGEMAKFNPFDPETGAEDGVQIYYYKGMKTRGVYPIPDYSASIPSCEIQIKIKEFHINELDNNFTTTGIINFNNGTPTKDERQEIEQGINRKFAGTKNAGRMMISFNEDAEHATTFVRLGTDDFADRYNSLADTSLADIFISMRAHPQLFGMTISTGFANIEYKEAFNLINKTQISKKQSEIERVFAKIFEKPDAIKFIPFSLDNNEYETE